MKNLIRWIAAKLLKLIGYRALMSHKGYEILIIPRDNEFHTFTMSGKALYVDAKLKKMKEIKL